MTSPPKKLFEDSCLSKRSSHPSFITPVSCFRLEDIVTPYHPSAYTIFCPS
jgi:hypothetical protein